MTSEDEIVKWLMSSKGYKEKSARDVASRIKRICKLDGTALHSADVEECVYRLSRNEAFVSLSLFVRSQLRRAAHLHFEFHAERKNAIN